jgi:hypothetical protein
VREYSSPHRFKKARPNTPPQHYKGVGIVAAKKQTIIFREPPFERCKARAASATLYFRNHWRVIVPE